MTELVLPLGTTRPEYPDDPLPDWVKELREHQVSAVREIVEAFEDGADVVYLDAPVGAGKTLIGELTRREMGVSKGLYVCTDKALQDQFFRDFDYARVLKGRANYIPEKAIGEITCEDCTYKGGGSNCSWCDPVASCPYRVARDRALGRKDGESGKWMGGARVAVLNTAYMLTAANFARTMRKYDLVVADECDMMEGAMTSFIEYRVPEWLGKLVGLDYPIKGARKPTIVKWLNEAAAITAAWMDQKAETLEVKQQAKVTSFIDETLQVAKYIQQDIDAAKAHEDDDSDEEHSGRWIRDYGDDRNPIRTLSLRPVIISPYGPSRLWKHGTKWLLMSGTVISSDEMSDSLGLPLDYRTVTIPSPFPIENRPIILAPVANVTAKSTAEDYEALAYALEQIAANHDGRMLVHTVSYKLTRELFNRCQMYAPDGSKRLKVQYTNSGEKYGALRKYLASDNAVIFAPSMDRGVDLKDDACRIQVIVKCPFPSLGDKQVSSRMHLPGGQQWYSVKTIRDIVQMTGRGVRSETDHCITFILDQQFTKNVWGKNKPLFPEYFREAVDTRFDVRPYMLRFAR